LKKPHSVVPAGLLGIHSQQKAGKQQLKSAQTATPSLPVQDKNLVDTAGRIEKFNRRYKRA